MSDPSIRVSGECRETNYQGSVTGPTEFVQLRSGIATAGLVAGDQILAINGRQVQELTLVDWRAEWARSSAADTPVQLRVRRSGSEIELPVPAGERAAVEGQFPQVSSFQCENPRGELSTESLVLDGADAAFIRVGDSAWQRVTRGANERFVVGVFDGRVGVNSEVIPSNSVIRRQTDQSAGDSPVPAGAQMIIGGSLQIPIVPLVIFPLLEFGFGHEHQLGRLNVLGDITPTMGGVYMGANLSYQFSISSEWHLGPIVGYKGFLAWQDRSPGNVFVGGLELSGHKSSHADAFLRLSYQYSEESVDIPMIGLGYRFRGVP